VSEPGRVGSSRQAIVSDPPGWSHRDPRGGLSAPDSATSRSTRRRATTTPPPAGPARRPGPTGP